MGLEFSLSFHRKGREGNLEIFHFSRSIREKGERCYKNKYSNTFCERTVAGIHHLLCLELLYLLWLSPLTGFSLSLPLLLLCTFHCFGAFQVVSIGLIHDRVDDVYLILREWLDREWVQGLSLWPWTPARCPPKLLSAGPLPWPWGNSSYNRPIVGVADSEWLWEPLRGLSQWLSENRSSCVCEKNECPDTGCCPGSWATWAWFYSEPHTRLWRAL